jgi:hypothetical protein
LPNSLGFLRKWWNVLLYLITAWTFPASFFPLTQSKIILSRTLKTLVLPRHFELAQPCEAKNIHIYIRKLCFIKVCCPQKPATNVVLRINHVHWSLIFILQINYPIIFLLLNKILLFQIKIKWFLKRFWTVLLVLYIDFLQLNSVHNHEFQKTKDSLILLHIALSLRDVRFWQWYWYLIIYCWLLRRVHWSRSIEWP